MYDQSVRQPTYLPDPSGTSRPQGNMSNLGGFTEPPSRATPTGGPQNGPQSQAPLLLNNLAQHLNNPPGPTGHPGQYGGGAAQGQGQGGMQQTGKLLLLPNGATPPPGSEEEKIYVLIAELLDPETRETALLELSKKREMYEDLALVLWGGFGE